MFADGLQKSLFQVLQNRCSPNNPEVVSVEVPRLQLVFGVLEHDLDELVKVEPDDGRPGARRRPGGAWPRREAVPLDDIGDVVVVRELERRVEDDERDAVDRAPPPAGDELASTSVLDGGMAP